MTQREKTLRAIVDCFLVGIDDDIAEVVAENILGEIEAGKIAPTIPNWKPIATCPLGTKVLLYEPKYELFPNYPVGPFLLIGSITALPDSKGEVNVYPAHTGGYEWECDMRHPTHWAEMPEGPEEEGKTK